MESESRTPRREGIKARRGLSLLLLLQISPLRPKEQARLAPIPQQALAKPDLGTQGEKGISHVLRARRWDTEAQTTHMVHTSEMLPVSRADRHEHALQPVTQEPDLGRRSPGRPLKRGGL